MKPLHLLACMLVLFHVPAFGQLLGPGSADPMPSSSIERANESIRARAAEESRRQEEFQRRVEQERRSREKAEREFAAKRDAARVEIRALPNSPDRQQQLDMFACRYPATATLPPSQQAVDDCIAELSQSREIAARNAAAAAAAIAEQASKAQQELEATQALRADQEREEAQRKAEQASAAAAVAAQEAAQPESRTRIVDNVARLIGLAGIIALGVYLRKAGWAAVSAAALMGFLSGFLVYLMAAMTLSGRTIPSSTFVWGTFFGGWALSMYLLLKGALSVSKVLSRGFLLGAAEWLLMIPVGLFFAGRAVTDTVATTDGSSAMNAGAVIGGGFIAFLTGGVSIVLAVLCLIAFAVTYFMTREMKPEQPAALTASPRPPAPKINRATFAEEFMKLAKLKEEGVLSLAEFNEMKAALIGQAKRNATK